MVLNCNEAYRQLFIDQKRCDVTFVCKDDNDNWEKIGAHKFHLSAISDVFETMFYGELVKSGATKDENEIRIEDISMKAFRLFLKFIYSEEVKFDHASTLAEFYSTAHKYNCKASLEFAADLMMEKISPLTSTIFYETAVIYDMPIIKEKCGKIMMYQTDEVLLSFEFLIASPEVVNCIFNLQKLAIDSELELVYALEHYIKYNKKHDPEIVKKIHPALNAIRFLTLTPADILETSLLTEDIKKMLIDSQKDLASMPSWLCKNKASRAIKKRKEIIQLLQSCGIYKCCACAYCNQKKIPDAHPLWVCPNISDRNILKKIFWVYHNTNLCNYASEDLEKLYKACDSYKLLKSPKKSFY